MQDSSLMAPIIKLGASRSDTNLFCRILEVLGVFNGWEKNNFSEATFFRKMKNIKFVL